MAKLKLKPILIGLMLIVVAFCEPLLKPSKLLADHDRVNLAQMIPEHFAGWHKDNAMLPNVNAQTDNAVGRLYDQTLVRTYVNSDSRRIMINIAYGKDQTEKRMHAPELCYRAQGFIVSDTRKTKLNYSNGVLPIKQFVGNLRGARNEPVTYWVSYGDIAVVDTVQIRLTRLRYVFSGLIPDGLLFRVSSVNNQTEADAFALHERFIKDLIASLSDQDRKALVKPIH